MPVAYISVLVGSLGTFSSLYRRRKVAKAAALEPWFPDHISRDVYLSLIHLDPVEGQKGNQAVPDSVLKAALLRRAADDIGRIVALRAAKGPLGGLVQGGHVGDDLWQSCLRAEKEIEEEVKDVVNEANAFVPGWGQVIFQTANEMFQNDVLRRRIEEVQTQAQAEKEWWAKKRSEMQADLMKEINDGASNTSGTSSSHVRQGSDEDTVLVEAGGPTDGRSKKKKGKK